MSAAAAVDASLSAPRRLALGEPSPPGGAPVAFAVAAADADAEGAAAQPKVVYPPLTSLDPSRCDELQMSARPLSSVWRDACVPLLKPVTGVRRSAFLFVELDTERLWNTFVAALPVELQVVWHGCARCKRFVTQYGNLVAVREAGKPLPPYDSADGVAAAAADKEGAAADAEAEGPPLEGAGSHVALELVPLLWNERVSTHPDLPSHFSASIAAVRALFRPQMAIRSAFLPVLADKQPGVALKDRTRTIGIERNEAGKPRPARGAEEGAQAAAAADAGAGADAGADAAAQEKKVFYHMHFTFPASVCREENDSHAHTTRLQMLSDTLDEYSPEVVARGYDWLVNHKVNYADVHKPAITMLHRLAQARIRVPDRAQRAVDLDWSLALWHTLTCSSPGMISSCRSGMVSKLLDLAARFDCQAGMGPINDAWDRLANPTSYMRATVDPLAGNVEAAERKFAELGITMEDLKRRYLKRSEVPERVVIFRQQQEHQVEGEDAAPAAAAAAVAAPAPAEEEGEWPGLGAAAAGGKKKKQKGGGLFSDLPCRNKDAHPPALLDREAEEGGPAKLVSFRALVASVLPTASKVEIQLPDAIGCQFLVTGEPGSAPLLAWHSDENDNRASSYAWGLAQQPLARWGLAKQAGAWTPVHMVLPLPWMWSDHPWGSSKDPSFPQHGERYLLALEGAEEGAGATEPGACLFPTWLRAKLHPVRSTIESFNNPSRSKMEGKDYLAKEGVAGLGIDVANSPTPPPRLKLRVTSKVDGTVRIFLVKHAGKARPLDEEEPDEEKPAAAASASAAAAADKKAEKDDQDTGDTDDDDNGAKGLFD